MSWTGYETFLRVLVKGTYYTPNTFAKRECLYDDEDGEESCISGLTSPHALEREEQVCKFV